MISRFNIYLTGVGGQGIGMLSEIILRAADYAGHVVKGVDTHGLAQRGGIVVSHLRLGDKVYSPLIPQADADLVIALERHEALRGIHQAARDGGTVVYYNTVWQPLSVRLDEAETVTTGQIKRACDDRQITLYEVVSDALPDTRMQNVAVLAVVDARHLIPALTAEHYHAAMTDLMDGVRLEKNLNLLHRMRDRWVP
jgi:indolepyruvate ferredoxin oxidoreductase beta subunit